MIPITKPTLGKDEIRAVTEVLESGMIVKGKVTEEVEKMICKICQRKYCVLLTSGTVSLNTTLSILGIQKRDEVITTPFTFIANATAIEYVGAKIVFADIEPNTFNIDPKEVEKKITKKTKAILAVDLFGHPFDYERLNIIAKKYNLFLIEDAAQAHGSIYKDKPTGSLGDVSIFSFYGSKIVTSGEGGAFLTDNKDYFERAYSYRSHGESKKNKYYFTSLGYNFMPTDIQAALLNVQLKKLKKFVNLRNKAANYYSKRLNNIDGLVTPTVVKGNKHAFCLYTIRIKKSFGNRNKVCNYLNENGIGARVYYPYSLHLQPLWKKLGYSFKKGGFPEAEKASDEVLSLPIFPGITKKDQDYVVRTLFGFKN